MVRIAATLLLAVAAICETAQASAPRLWTRATPAAGVPICSATNFRVYAVSSSINTSIDLYGITSGGASAKLGTLIASIAGTYSTGVYSAQGMAAIYWQFSSLPPASITPPPVTVTFFNDSPSVPLTSLYYGGPPQVPFDAADPSLLLDLDLRGGVPPGWTSAGSGTFDATNGYTPGTAPSSGLSSAALAAFSGAQSMPEGSVAIRFQRTGVSTDDSFGSNFWDSTGNTLNASTQTRQLLMTGSNSGSWGLQVQVHFGAIPFLEVVMQTGSMSTPLYFWWQTVNSHFVTGYQDPVFADLVFTWFQNQYYIFFDGHLVAAGALGDVPIDQMFQNICLGNFETGGMPSGSPFGAYAIQRLQISSRFLGPVLAGPTIGLLPDSFAAGYTQRPSPVASGSNGSYQVSDIDAVQNALGLYTGMAALTVQPGQTSTFHQIQALMFENYGFYPPIYNAGQEGHGYSHINAPIDDAYIAALNNATPAIVMAGGSVNDVSVYKPSDGNLIPDTEAILNRLIDGGGTSLAALPNPSLEQIIYLEMLSSQGANPDPAVATESQNLISLTRAQLSGFVPNGGAGFGYVPSREWWNESPDYATYLYGTAPASRFNGPGGPDNGNSHPDATGFSVIAAHLYAPIASAVLNTAGADLALQGTGSFISQGSGSFNLQVSNAGPLTAAGVVVTSILPAGVTLAASAAGSTCSQSGNVVSCQVGTLSSGATASIGITLQAPGTLAAATTFAVGDANGSDPVTGNNTATIAPLAPTPNGIQASIGTAPTSVVVSWNVSPGSQSYTLFGGSSAGGGSPPVATNITGTTFTVTGLTAAQTYYFAVAAIDSGGASANSPAVAVTLPPAAPTALSASAGNGSVNLNWSASGGATSYNVYVGTAPGQESSAPSQSGLVQPTATIASLANGQTYYFTVRAVNDGGASSASAETSATPTTPPAAPAGGGGSMGALEIALLGLAAARRVIKARRGHRISAHRHKFFAIAGTFFARVLETPAGPRTQFKTRM